MSTKLRFLTSLAGNDADYERNDVASLASVEASGLKVAGVAIDEGPVIASAVYAAYRGAGYTDLTVDGSGQYVAGSGGVGAWGGVYLVDDYHMDLLTPHGDLLRMVLVRLEN